MAFSIPSNVVKGVVNQILRFGNVERPWVGIAVDGTRSGSAGLFVAAVAPQSPAAAAGIRPGDFITAVNGHLVQTVSEWLEVIASSKVGEKLTLTVWRGTDQLSVPIRVGTRPTDRKVPAPAS